MDITSKIDHLIFKLNDFKFEHKNSDNSSDKKFLRTLEESIDALSKDASISGDQSEIKHAKVPKWVNEDYDFNNESPRKPNMRELMEAISGRSIDELYADPSSDWKKIADQSSELLYGVIGSNGDKRNWSEIMQSEKIVDKARIETHLMHEPVIEIENKFDENTEIVEQYAVIKNKYGENLRVLNGNPEVIDETLRNFGASKSSIPLDLDKKIRINNFNSLVLDGLKKFAVNGPDFSEKNLEYKLNKQVTNAAVQTIAKNLDDNLHLQELKHTRDTT